MPVSLGQKDELLPKYHELYETFRSYVRHEDWLINARLTWNLTVQGFLFAGYGLLAQKVFEFCTGGKAEHVAFGALVWTLWILPILGIAVSAMSLVGIYAARKAIESVNSKWKDKKEQNPKLNEFPELTGGGAKRAHDLGFFKNYLPFVFILAWIALLVTTWVLGKCPQATQNVFHFAE